MGSKGGREAATRLPPLGAMLASHIGSRHPAGGPLAPRRGGVYFIDSGLVCLVGSNFSDQDRMSALSLRVTMTALELQEKKFYEYLAERSDGVCCVEHFADANIRRTHCHIYVAGCKVKYDAINDRLTSIGVAKGNTGRTIKYKDVDEGIITYMSKGKLDPSFLYGITREHYDYLRSKWIEPEKSSPVKNEKAKRVEKTDFQIYEEIVEALQTPYKCGCFACAPNYQKGTISYDPEYKILWDPDNSHEHVKHAVRVIRDVRIKHKKLTNHRKMEEYLFMLVNHRDINQATISRLEKFLFN